MTTKDLQHSLPQPLIKSLEHVVLAKESSQPQSSYEAAASLTEFELKRILLDKIEKSQSYLTATEHRECYDGLIKSYELDKSLFSTYDKVYSLKRSRKDKDKDEDPSAGSDQGLKKRKTSKDVEPTKGLKTKESKSGSSKGTKSRSTSSGNSALTEEPEFEVADYDMQSKMESGALSEKLDWDNPEGGDYLFDLTKPLPLVTNRNRQIVPVDYFFNKYLKEQRKTFYAYARGLESSHDAYSTKRILAVTRVEVMQKHRYGYLREIEVRRADNHLYKFKEGDFPQLCINDIEDMLILFVQNRLTNLSSDDVSDFAIALRMFTRSIVILKRVEDL
ncbi:hypothetical protein Tco_0349209 [Tanacetum coccineum]